MTAHQKTKATGDQQMTPEDAKLWRDRWRQAAEMDRQLRADRLKRISWERDWPWIDGLLNLGATFASPRLPVSLIAYRRRLAERFAESEQQ